MENDAERFYYKWLPGTNDSTVIPLDIHKVAINRWATWWSNRTLKYHRNVIVNWWWPLIRQRLTGCFRRMCGEIKLSTLVSKKINVFLYNAYGFVHMLHLHHGGETNTWSCHILNQALGKMVLSRFKPGSFTSPTSQLIISWRCQVLKLWSSARAHWATVPPTNAMHTSSWTVCSQCIMGVWSD